MKKVLFILIAALGFSCSSYAQMSEKEIKKATKAAQKTVKDARSFYERDDASARDKADGKRMIDEAIKNPLLVDWDQTWATAALIYREQFFNETVNFNTGSKCDTVAMYDYLVKWFNYSTSSRAIFCTGMPVIIETTWAMLSASTVSRRLLSDSSQSCFMTSSWFSRSFSRSRKRAASSKS